MERTQIKPRLPYKPGVDLPFDRVHNFHDKISNFAEDYFAQSGFTQISLEGKLLTSNDFAYRDCITSSDVALIEQFYGQMDQFHQDFKLETPVFNPGMQRTLDLVKRYAGFFGERINEQGGNYNISTLESLALFHDIGRIFSHRRRVTDLWGNTFLNRIGFNPQFTALLPTEQHWWPVTRTNDLRKIKELRQRVALGILSPDEAQKIVANIPFINDEATSRQYQNIGTYTTDIFDDKFILGHSVRGIIEAADVLGKPLANGDIMDFADLNVTAVKDRQPLPHLASMWSGEFIRQSGVVTHLTDVNIAYANLYKWLESKMNITMDEAVTEIRRRLIQDPLIDHY